MAGTALSDRSGILPSSRRIADDRTGAPAGTCFAYPPGLKHYYYSSA
jgi:hypothetical protein